jgi:tetratricopeptide (TPR) repeat protein
MFRSFLLLLFFFDVSQKIYAQQISTCESKNVFIIGDSLVNNNPTKAIDYYTTLIEKQIDKSDECYSFFAMHGLALSHINAKQFESATLQLQKLFAFVNNSTLKNIKYYQQRIDIVNGVLLLRTGSFLEAAKVFEKIIYANEFKNDIQSLFRVYLYRAMVYQNMQVKDTALKFCNEVIQKFEPYKNQLKDYYRTAVVKAYIYRDFEKYQVAVTTILPFVEQIKKENTVLLANVYPPAP